MSTMIKLDIKIGGQSTDLVSAVDSLHITSRYDGHHTFEIQVSLSRNNSIDLADIGDHLGEPIDIQYWRTNWGIGSASTFRGFVDEIVPSWTASGGRIVTLKGWSPTVFLDCGPVFRCFSDTTLEDVINKTIAPYRRFFPNIVIKTKQNQQIPWSVQGNETSFQFICRLADQSGLQEFWYDGQSLHFDDLTHAGSEEINLVKGEALHSLSLSLNTTPLSFSVKTYDYVNGGFPEASANPISSNNPLIDLALRKSGAYPTQKIALSYPMEGNQGLKSLIRRFASKQAHELLVLSGQSDDPRLVIGSKVKFDTRDDMLEPELAGQFVIIHVNHHISKDGHYENGFVAVPTSHPYNLRMNSGRGPMTSPMAAVVADCDDPKRLGRVRVRFLADELQALSPWLRCLTPYTSNGGVFQIPAQSEHVIVFAEDFNLERGGFVMNSYFHKNSPATKWKPATERGWRWGSTGMMSTKDQVNTWGDNVQTNARKNWSFDGQRGDLNSGKGSIPA